MLWTYTVEKGAFQVDARTGTDKPPIVNVPAPKVTVKPPDVKVDVPRPQVTVNLPDEKPKRLVKDKDGNTVGVEPVDRLEKR